jgi:hypothetical protein
VAALAGLEDRLGDVDVEHVVLAGLEAVEAVGEDGERDLDGRLHDDRVPDGRISGLRVHERSFSSIACSTADR